MASIRRRKHKSTKMKHSITTGSQIIMNKVPRVKDLMAHDPLILTLGMTVHDAAKKLLQNHRLITNLLHEIELLLLFLIQL